MQDYLLIAKSPFRDYKKGDFIQDAEEVKKILTSHERRMVVKQIISKKVSKSKKIKSLMASQLRVVVQSTNSLVVPDAYVQLISPQPTIQGAQTNIVGIVGIASYGPVDVPVTLGTIQQQIQHFGPVLPETYDLGTAVYQNTLQGVQNFNCVRVTDGTDSASTTNLLDADDAIGAILTSLYTGELGDTLTATIGIGSSYTPSAPTYQITLNISGGIPETFDNIGGEGGDFWAALINAINLGQSIARGPSQLVVASLPSSGITGITINEMGVYAVTPAYQFTGSGSGAMISPQLRVKTGGVTTILPGTGYAPNDTILLAGGTHSVQADLKVTNTKLVSFTLSDGGADFAVNDILTFTDGTFTTSAILTVDTVDVDGAILTAHVSRAGVYTVNSAGAAYTTSGIGTGATFSAFLFGVQTTSISIAGNYTILPTNPVSQTSSSGSGTGVSFKIDWEIFVIQLLSSGSGYNNASQLIFSNGDIEATVTLLTGAIGQPEQDTYEFAGGTNGNDGVTSTTLVGSDVSPRTGMYALRQTNSFIVMLADAYDPAQWPAQSAFSITETCYVIATVSAGYQDNIAGALSLLQASAINNYGFTLLTGDWVQINDPFNNVTRYISPQSSKAGILAFNPPYTSALNKPVSGIIATQRTAEGNPYSIAELSQIITGRLEVITRPIPVNSFQFGCRSGVNTSSNSLTKTDNYTMMANFLARSISNSMGVYIGQDQTPAVQTDARNEIQTFLMGLFQNNFIGDVNRPGNAAAAFQVILDSTNNPSNQVAAGYMQANVTVVIFSIIQFFVVNVNLIQGSSNITIPTPTANT